MDLRIEQTFVQAETGEQFEGDKKEKGMRAAEAECPRNTAAHERVKIHDGADGDGRQYAEDIEAGQGCGEPDSQKRAARAVVVRRCLRWAGCFRRLFEAAQNRFDERKRRGEQSHRGGKLFRIAAKIRGAGDKQKRERTDNARQPNAIGDLLHG